MTKNWFWDDWTIEHIWQHRVTPRELVEVRRNQLLVTRAGQGHMRMRAVGVTDSGRYLTVFLDPEGEGVYYVVTARDATNVERPRYLAAPKRRDD